MAEENKVVLHGMWASPYAKRVELALKIKGIPFEYVEEDLQNKSELLLKFNPVYKKVPVLVHNGKPIAESHVIIEYIDENWRNEPKLLPEDHYDRARVRFWAGYFQQVLESSMKLINPDRDAQQKGLEEVHEKLRVLEAGMKDLFPAGFPGNHGQHRLGLLDILVVASLGAYKIYEQVLEVKMLDPEKNPLIYSWVNSLIELSVVKEVAAPPEKIVSLLQRYRDRLQTSKGIELKV